MYANSFNTSCISDCATVSGLNELDYPKGAAFTNIKQLVPINKLPLPPEIMEKFSCILYKEQFASLYIFLVG